MTINESQLLNKVQKEALLQNSSSGAIFNNHKNFAKELKGTIIII